MICAARAGDASYARSVREWPRLLADIESSRLALEGGYRGWGRSRLRGEAHIRNTPKRVSSIGALRQAERASDSTRRVSEGRMMPSSQSLAVAK
jgi:hypothetical protein